MLLARIGLQIVGNALGLIAAAVALSGVSLTARALLLDVLVFTGVGVVVLPLLRQAAERRDHALVEGAALAACLVALVVTAILSDGLRIEGVANWLAATVIVWAVALIAGVLVPWAITRWRRRAQTDDDGERPNVYRWR